MSIPPETNKIAEYGPANRDSRELRRSSLLWFRPFLIPILPVLLALVLLELIGAHLQLNEINSIINGALETDKATILRHGSSLLMFATAAVIHTGVCVSAIAYYGILLKRIGGSDRRPIVAMTVITALAVLSAMVGLAYLESPLAVHRYSYFIIKELLCASPFSRALTGVDDTITPTGINASPTSDACKLADVDGIPMISVYVMYPSTLGVIAVAMASGVACASLRCIGTAENGVHWAERLRSHARLLLHCFYALSAVLVTSTITASLFLRLPLSLFAADDSALYTALAEYTNALTTFWSAVYTLTLFSVFAVPVAVIYNRIYNHIIAEDQDLNESVNEWLKRHGIEFSVGGNIMNILTLIAPLLAGPFMEFVKVLGG